MGAFTKLFGKGKATKQLGGYFEMLDGYTPVFSTYDGGVYEMELTRSCIHTFANHCSKLTPVVSGANTKAQKALLDGRPNPFMTSAQFVYKVATIYDAQNTCFIIPVLDGFEKLIGYYPVNPMQVEIIEVSGEPWLRYTFRSGQKAAIELARCGVVSKYLYSSDIKGENNAALRPTLQLLNVQNQGIEEGIRNSASFRFMATVNNFAKAEDLKKERKKFVAENLGPDSGGLALFPNTYTNVQQIKSQPEIVDPEQMQIIQTRVLNYFGCNEDVLQNKTVGDAWSAYYEGKIEPFALQLSQAMTCMTFTRAELARGNSIMWSANRLQYMTNSDKLQVSSQMFDRGILSTNDVMDIWQLPHVPDGDKRYIRKEYAEISKLDQAVHPRRWKGRTKMTPENKIKFKANAQARSLVLLPKKEAEKRIETNYYVEGYAARYEPYVLYYDGDEPIYERFERGCFDDCDMSDVIMQFDHAGRVFARSTNGSLIVGPDDVGLFMAADLGRTEGARGLYADIDAEMITKMSWRFRVGDYYWDAETRTIVHRTVKKIYDVSAVSIPANDNTEINARSWADGVISLAARSEAELDDRRRRLRLKIKLNSQEEFNYET